LLTAILFFISLFLYGALLFSLKVFSEEEKLMIINSMRNRLTARKKSDIAKTL